MIGFGNFGTGGGNPQQGTGHGYPPSGLLQTLAQRFMNRTQIPSAPWGQMPQQRWGAQQTSDGNDPGSSRGGAPRGSGAAGPAHGGQRQPNPFGDEVRLDRRPGLLQNADI